MLLVLHLSLQKWCVNDAVWQVMRVGCNDEMGQASSVQAGTFYEVPDRYSVHRPQFFCEHRDQGASFSS